MRQVGGRSLVASFITAALPSVIVWNQICLGFSAAYHGHTVAPELSPQSIEKVTELVSTAMGDCGEGKLASSSSKNRLDRYASVRSLARQFVTSESSPEEHELVYGELSVPVLATVLDAVGVRRNERFLDIGSGDGALVLGAALLYPEYMEASRGVELVHGLIERSKQHAMQLRQIITDPPQVLQNIDFFEGDVHGAHNNPEMSALLADTTLAVCFATTWSANNAFLQSQQNTLVGRRLPKLSSALSALPPGSRLVLVDGRLDCKESYRWEGDLRVQCPDTAPYSMASLYERI